MGPPARLNMRHEFAFKPGEIGVHRENDEKQQHDLDDRNNQLGVCGENRPHGFAFASGRDSIMVQKRPSVPLVKSVSSAERINPAGTSYGACPFLANCTRVGSAPPVSNPAC